MRLSIELVPRDEASMASQLAEVSCLSRVDTINVPDLRQFELRVLQAAAQVRSAGQWAAVLHLRATEVCAIPGAAADVARALASAGVREVLVVSGDQGPATTQTSGRTSAGKDAVTSQSVRPLGLSGPPALEAIRVLKAADAGLKVYAALDPYRAGFSDELAYAEAKLEAGADGLFTQPFFDLRLLDVWRELTAGVNVFWGVTSVTSARSQRYWLSRNRAVFPAGFEPTLEWHRKLAARVIDDVGARGGNLYFMPIRVGIVDWLGDLLA